MGYDISDYKAIDERYGSMADHDELVSECHKRGLKYVMDLVVNHTSDQHQWFKESKKAGIGGGGKRDWYIWREGKKDEDGVTREPNNWESAFSGSAWTWDEESQEYYLHLFAKEQPDLNWDNVEVRKEVLGMMRWWLQKGVDGFRMDVINFISKEPGLPDGEITRDGYLQNGVKWFACGPRLHEYLREIGKLLKEFDAFSVGEMPGVQDEMEIVKAVNEERGELAMAFQFDIVDMDHMPEGKWLPRRFTPSALKEVVRRWQRFMIDNGGWNALYMENHDQGRTISRYADDSEDMRMKSAKLLAGHLALQCGTVFVYQGQELGMANVPKDWGLDKYKDLEQRNHWETVLRDHPDDQAKQQMFKDQYRLIGRDNARTPMQWSAKKYAGFMPESVHGEPWMDVHPDFKKWNADALLEDKDSSFHYWKKLLKLRKQEKDLFVYGDFEMLDTDNEFGDVIAYVRTKDMNDASKKKALVIANFGKADVSWTVPAEYTGMLFAAGKLRKDVVVPELRNYAEENEVEGTAIRLRPFEIVVAVSRD